MSISKKSHELIRQNEQIVKKSQKHDANLQKNSTLYFQIGLIVCLMAAYGLLEMKFDNSSISPEIVCNLPIENIEVSEPKFKVYVEPIEEIKPHVKKKVDLTKNPEIVDNDKKILEEIEVVIHKEDTTLDLPIDPNELDGLVEVTEEVIVDFIFIEDVPVYPGCENKESNAAKKKCMSEKLTKLIQKKFNTEIAGDLGLSGIQKIQTQFTIDKKGTIIDVETRAPHVKLENEARRVIKKIPTMKPGKQRDKPVGVRYTLPIIFQVE